jgi:hypothetical protein
MLTRSELLNTLGRGYARAILGGVTGHYAWGHLDIIRRRIHANSRATPLARLQQHHGIGRAASPDLSNHRVREYEKGEQ